MIHNHVPSMKIMLKTELEREAYLGLS